MRLPPVLSRVLLLGAATALAAGLWAVAWRTKRPNLPPMRVERVETDLIADLPSATIADQNPRSKVRAGLLFTGAKRVDNVERGGERPALLAAPPSAVRFRLHPRLGERLGFSAALDLDWPEGVSATVRFVVRVGEEAIFDRKLDRSTVSSGDWIDGEASLDAYAGREVTVSFETVASPSDPETVLPAGWGAPRIFRAETIERSFASRSEPNVLLVVIDTLRADAVRAYGAARPTSPTLDALAARGILYEQAFSTSAWTWPATASILSGLYPYTHAVRRPEQCYLSDEIVTIAEQFQRQEVTTAAFSANSLICRAQNFAQGFETFQEFFEFGQRGGPVADAFRTWLDAMHEARFFAYVHLMDPHFPYAPPQDCLDALRGDRTTPDDDARFREIAEAKGMRPLNEMADRKEWMRIAYDADVLGADRAVGAILEAIEKKGLADRTLVVVTSDHGEEFFEHGAVGHARTLYDELLHVPLLLVDPRRPGGLRVREQVETIQIFPTLCEIADVPGPRGLARGPLPPFAEAGAPEAFATTDKGETNDPWFRNQNSIRTPEWKLVYWPATAGKREQSAVEPGTDKVVHTTVDRESPEVLRLFHLATSPEEKHDVAATETERAMGLKARLVRWIEETKASGPKNLREPSRALIARLKALGYVDGDHESDLEGPK